MGIHEGVIALFVPIIGSIGAFTMVVFLRHYTNRERMAMIERGMNPADLKLSAHRNDDPQRSIRIACTAIGIGLGLFVGNILRSIEFFNKGGIVAGLVFMLGGLGLLIGYYMQYALQQRQQGKDDI